jgi:hypothetical protein
MLMYRRQGPLPAQKVDNRGASGTQGPPQSGQLKPAPPAPIRPLLRDLRRAGPQGGRASLSHWRSSSTNPTAATRPATATARKQPSPPPPSTAQERRTAAADRSLAASAQLIGPALNKASPYSRQRSLPASGLCRSGRSNVTTALHMITTHRMY